MNGAPRENIFQAYDGNEQRCGMAAVAEYINHAVLPERPLNYYLTLEGFARARDMLFGAAYARARILRAKHPELPARIYASCSPRDPERLMFFGEMGFRDTDSEYVMRRVLRADDRLPKPPVGTRIAATRLSSDEACERLLSRMNPYSVTARGMDWLDRARSEHFFAAYAVLEEDRILGEALINGYGAEGRVLMIYTLPKYRRHGVARALLAAADGMFIEQGYKGATALVWERCRAAMELFETCGYSKASQSILYPGINL
jgi:GNAT superfamily N-acetyltransferase